MPQLNPNPWFLILVFSWLTFLTIIPTKVLSHITPNEPAPMNIEEHKTDSWNWPW
uniref:ATP synthase complex subunit 8 n=1 Tax=Henicorhynchus lobatus TaxID=488203 RepID=A9YDN7_9TELE|nr:ATPase 8 [Henicorhynchus lobatus]ABY47932.1 ATPase 8 [Henicorhynchus lobatus]ABY47934.1 ATPase 8 [Henicorhynchus lobatus]ABY47936.1 ATPase 8 [Henicorhynchus lobatus]ABY47938.1 ATPase 8 [Henicorhynchus lobatus]